MSLCHDPVPIFDGFYVLTNQTKMAASSNVIEFHFIFKVLYELYSVTGIFHERKLFVLKNIMNQTSHHKFIRVKYVLAWTKFETVATCDDQFQTFF